MKFGLQNKNAKDIFVLFSALNAMGYNSENNSRGMSPIRKKVRKILLKQNWGKKYPHLKNILKKHHPYTLLLEVLKKAYTSNKNDATFKKTYVSKFTMDFGKFSNEPIINDLWKNSNKYQTKESKIISELFRRETTKLIKFLRKPANDVKKIILIVNPLDAYWRGYGLKINDAGYIIVGPGAEKSQGELIRHELLHLLAPKFKLPPKIITDSKNRRLASMGYSSRNIINREYVIRSLNLVYESEVLEKDISKSIKREEKDFKKIREVIEIIKMKLEKGPHKGGPHLGHGRS